MSGQTEIRKCQMEERMGISGQQSARNRTKKKKKKSIWEAVRSLCRDDWFAVLEAETIAHVGERESGEDYLNGDWIMQ